MSVFINIILILVSLVLIVAVLMQEGNKQGLGAIGGAAETFLGKNTSKSYEGKLLNITRIGAAVFVVLAILATWMNARTYTVTYYDEDGNEYFPSLAEQVMANNFAVQYGLSEGDTITYAEAYESSLASYVENGYTEADMQEALRVAYTKGDEIDTDYVVPTKTGYTGVWMLDSNNDGVIDDNDEGELPAKMGRTNYVMRPVYTIGTYTVTVIDNGLQPEEVTVTDETVTVTETEEYVTVTETEESVTVTEGTATETEEEADTIVFTFTAEYGTAIDYGTLAAKPEQIDEYYVFYSYLEDAQEEGYIYNIKLPETVPGEDTTIYVNYAHGNFITYYTMQNVAQKDEEGNVVYDEEGNVVYELDENGEIKTEEVEWYPDFTNNLYYSVMESWEDTYADVYGDDYTAYLNAFAAALADDGEITVAVNNYYAALLADYTANDTLDAMRSFVEFGSETAVNSVPTKTGYVGYWDTEVPEIMDGKYYELRPVYYPAVTLTVIDDGVDGSKIPVDEVTETEEGATVTENVETETVEAAETEEKHNVVFELTDGEGLAINYGELVLPEAPEGYSVKWSCELPEVMPAEDLVITAVYEPIAAEVTVTEEAATETK